MRSRLHGAPGLALGLFVLATGCEREVEDGQPLTGITGGATATVTAAQLLTLTSSCRQISTGKFATDSGGPATIPICGLDGAVFWKADMDIDCDGKRTATCNEQTDPWFQNQTSATTSTGQWLDSSTLPFVVIPQPSSRFDYRTAGLKLGSVIAVIYDGKLKYGVFGDTGPSGIIGEASYAMASALGIDPDPHYGGVSSGVTYIAFTGASGVVSRMEDAALATSIGNAQASLLTGSSGTCAPESDTAFCRRLGKNCGTVAGNDNCGQRRTVSSCGSCTSPASCGGGGTANVCASASGSGSETNSSCSFAVTKNVYDGPAWWGTIAFKNNGPATSTAFQVAFDVPSGVQCDYAPSGWIYSQSGVRCSYRKPGASLAAGSSLTFNYSTNSQSFSEAGNVIVGDATCAPSSSGTCTPESDTSFCTRRGATCGSVTGADNCGKSRTVDSCGTCTSPGTCGGSDTPNVCGSSEGTPSEPTPSEPSSKLVWKRANLTYFSSYPAPGSDECLNYNGCTWAGQFAGLSGKQPESWVRANNIAAVHSKDFATYKLKTLRLVQGSKQIDVKVYDMCADSDCSGCCTANSRETGFLIDLESYTAERFGSSSGIVQWACLDC